MKTLKSIWLWFIEFFRGPRGYPGPSGPRGLTGDSGYTPTRLQVATLVREELDRREGEERQFRASSRGAALETSQCLDHALNEVLTERRTVGGCAGQEAPRRASKFTLPTDSAERKGIPILRGCVRYFPAALAGVAIISQKGNDKHNPGEELHHARGKSTDHGDCILRHLIDIQDLTSGRGSVSVKEVLTEVDQLAWRALALSQELHERYGKAPLAPGAK